MDSFESQLQIKLDELRQLTNSALQNGINLREPLSEFAKSINSLANKFADICEIIQDDEPGKRGEPILASPSKEEWDNFPAFITSLRHKDIHGVGIALVTLPEGHTGVGILDEDKQLPLNGWRFAINRHPKDSRYMTAKLLQDGAALRSEQHLFRLEPGVQFGPKPPSGDSLDDIVRHFEEIALDGQFNSPIYAAGKDVALPLHRLAYNLRPESLIFPLSGNRLEDTIGTVPGVHTPWMYVSQGHGTPFSLHSEDMNLVSLNVLLKGDSKVWTSIASHHHEKFENMILADLGIKKKKCDDVIRHENLYVSRAILDENEIHYCQFEQQVGQVVVTFPLTYHQGFNSGPNIAEAVNYAEKRWNPATYQACSKQVCGHRGPGLDTFRLRTEGQPQDAPIYNDPTELEAILPIPAAVTTQAPVSEMPESSSNKRPKRVSQQPRPPSPLLPPPRSPRKRPASAPVHPNPVMMRLCEIRPSQPAHAQPPQPASQPSIDEMRQIFEKEARDKEARKQELENERLEKDQRQFWTRWEANQCTLTARPKLQPIAIYNGLQIATIGSRTQSRKLQLGEIDAVTKLVAAWASTDAFLLLKSLFPKIRDCGMLVESGPATSAADPVADVRALDGLGGSDAWNAIRNRYHLARFSQSFDERVSAGNKKSIAAFYKNIMASAYPHLSEKPDRTDPTASLDEYKLKYESLSRSVRYGRYWKRIADRLGWGVLSLLPTGGAYGISNSTIHQLKIDVFDLFLDTLTREKGDWLKNINEAMTAHLEGAMKGSLVVNSPQLLLENTADQEITRCADQSAELALLASPISQAE